MYIKRQLDDSIKPFLLRKEALSIIGPRQAGKTTLITNLAIELEKNGKKVKFLTFEKQSELELFNNDIEGFKNLYREYDCILIDEFQYAKDGGQKLKYLYDTTPQKYIVTGSSSLDLTFQTGKYMVGRLLEFTLLPFSFTEFLEYKSLDLFKLDLNISSKIGPEIITRLVRFLEEYTLYGGYPAVVLSDTSEEKVKVLEGITQKYLLRDIRDLLRLATDDELWTLEKFLATQIGNMVNYEELSRSSGISRQLIKKYLNILEKTFVIKMIKPYFVNKRTELTKNPKVFFIDLGLRNFVLSDFRPVATRPDFGAIMENYGLLALMRRFDPTTVRYWRTKSKAEVDFVVEYDQKAIPFEVKYSSSPKIGRSLFSFLNKYHPPEAYVLTKDFSNQDKRSGDIINYVPLALV